MIRIITAMTNDRVIGKGNSLPWKIPEELKFFKMMTINQTIIYGSTTLESIGHILMNRCNLILSSKPQSYFDIYGGCQVFSDFDECVKFAKTLSKDVYICGGASVYKQALEKDFVDELVISFIKKEYLGDVRFPDFVSMGWMTKEVIYETDSFVTKKYRK